MAKPAARIAVVQLGLALGLAAIVGRAAQLQIFQHDKWEAVAAENRTDREALPARRGTIYDRHGVALAITQEFYHVGVAPNEVKDRGEVVTAVARAVGKPAGVVRAKMDRQRYAHFEGPFPATRVQHLRGLRGVHLTGYYRRWYGSGDLARPIIGRLRPDTALGASGLELSLDSLLSGIPGETVVLKDRLQRRYESPARHLRDPVPGHDVRLTIDAELQDIAERELDDAIAEFDADGGDVVFLHPRNGELLAIASRQAGRHDNVSARASVFTDTYEPGSTAKLFTAAALLALGRVDSTDSVAGENGVWYMPITERRVRRITDTEREPGMLTLAQAIEKSSNIAMVKFTERISDAEQFEMLRRFGFGSPTGVEFPSEARGALKFPAQYNERYSRFSMAMGYEFSVTPVQLAAAYAAIANDGVLVTPTLIREVIAPDGSVLYTHRPEPVRRVVSSEIAAKLRRYLREAASTEGTGSRAQLAGYRILGKTGTARMVVNGTYDHTRHTASFAAIFPAEDPQLVVVVKIDNPRRGSHYGGVTAAPVVPKMLRQALASGQVELDRSRLVVASATPSAPVARERRPVQQARAAVVSWPLASNDSAPAPAEVPALDGAPLRDAVRALHGVGLQVRLRGAGSIVRRTDPDSGRLLARGGTVTVWTEE